MSPRKPVRTEKHEKALQKAIAKQTAQGKGQAVQQSIGARVRQAAIENA